MGLPLTRDLTLAANATVPSSLLNNLQDAVVNLNNQMGGAFVNGWLGRHLFANSSAGTSSAVLRPFGAAGGFKSAGVSGGTHIVLQFFGGLLLGSNGPATFPWMPYLLTTDTNMQTDLDPPPGAGQYRRDIVSVRLTYAGGVIFDYLLTTGTPAGTENGAVDPATPAGYTKFMSILSAGAVVATSVDPLKIRDYRFPLGYHDVMCLPGAAGMSATSDFGAHVSADWEVATAYVRQANAGGDLLTIFPFARPIVHQMRVKRIVVRSDLDTGAVVRLIRKDFLDTLVQETIETPTANLSNGFWVITPTWPLWGNGYSNPNAASLTSAQISSWALGMEIVSGTANDKVNAVGWEFWGGTL